MTTVFRQDDLIESVADALQYISYYHPVDFIQAMNDAYVKEANPAAKDAMAQILINSRMCAEGPSTGTRSYTLATSLPLASRNVKVTGVISVG